MLKVNYDQKFDIIYISIGEPRPSFGEENISGLVVLRDILTEEITGLTIFDFKKRLQNNSINELEIPIVLDLDEIAKSYLH